MGQTSFPLRALTKSGATDGQFVKWDQAQGKYVPATASAWGSITGTLSNQTDLQNALNAKLSNTLPGSASEILYRSGANTLGALTGSSVSGSDLKLGGKLGIGVTAVNEIHVHTGAAVSSARFTNTASGSGSNNGVQIGLDTDGSAFIWNYTERLRFATSNVERLQISTAGHLLPFANNSYDIGSSANRMRSIYVGTSIGIGGSPVSSLTIPVAPTASANFGLVSLGAGPFNGSTAGFFVGSSSGAVIAINAASGFGGNLADWQVAGVRKFLVDSSGNVNVSGLAQLRAPSTTSIRERAEWSAAAIDNTDATRKYRSIFSAYDTAAREFLRGWGDGSAGRIAVAAPASAPTDAHIAASQISFYLDESGHNLLVRAKYADGTTLKLATLALA